MSTDGSGVYTLPEAAFAPNTLATSASVNNNFADIATGLTDRVTRNGTGSMSGPLTLSGDPTEDLHAAPKQYADAAPAARCVAVSGLWESTNYNPGATDEVFFSVNIPEGTRAIVGSIFARASSTTAGYASAHYTAKVVNGASSVVASFGAAILSVHSTLANVASTGGTFAFTLSEGAATSGSTLKFYVRNPDVATATHHVQQYTATALCIY